MIASVHFCLTIQQVISAQQLPKINKEKQKSIVDPLVKVEIHGVQADNASKETHHIENNGEHYMCKYSISALTCQTLFQRI